MIKYNIIGRLYIYHDIVQVQVPRCTAFQYNIVITATVGVYKKTQQTGPFTQFVKTVSPTLLSLIFAMRAFFAGIRQLLLRWKARTCCYW
jgi:hypothetical protein